MAMQSEDQNSASSCKQVKEEASPRTCVVHPLVPLALQQQDPGPSAVATLPLDADANFSSTQEPVNVGQVSICTGIALFWLSTGHKLCQQTFQLIATLVVYCTVTDHQQLPCRIRNIAVQYMSQADHQCHDPMS